jgi:hypothetical protein
MIIVPKIVGYARFIILNQTLSILLMLIYFVMVHYAVIFRPFISSHIISLANLDLALILGP